MLGYRVDLPVSKKAKIRYWKIDFTTSEKQKNGVWAPLKLKLSASIKNWSEAIRREFEWNKTLNCG